MGMVQAAVPRFGRGVPETRRQVLTLAQADGRAAGNTVQRVRRNGHIGVELPCNIAGQAAQQGPAAGEQHAGGGNICRQLRRGAFQHVAGRGGNAGGKLLHRLIQIAGVDKAARRVWVNGEEKQFTTKEFDLLTFLAENPNHVFTKEELFRKIWDMESIGDIATVTVHIKKIREKIEMNTNKPQYIETIWGVGYRFKL